MANLISKFYFLFREAVTQSKSTAYNREELGGEDADLTVSKGGWMRHSEGGGSSST